MEQQCPIFECKNFPALGQGPLCAQHTEILRVIEWSQSKSTQAPIVIIDVDDPVTQKRK